MYSDFSRVSAAVLECRLYPDESEATDTIIVCLYNLRVMTDSEGQLVVVK